MDNNKKPLIRWPGSSTLMDGTRPVIYAGPAISTGVFGLLFCMGLGLMLTWWNIPFLPLPPSDKPALYHAYAFYAMWVGKFLPFLRFDTYHSYLNQIIQWSDQGQGAYLLARWVFALLAGVAGGYGFLKLAWKPVSTERQVRGRVLLEGKEGYHDLKREFAVKLASGKIPGLVMLSDKGLNPNKPHTFVTNKETERITFPDAQRRSHSVIIGGSGRGKTQYILGLFMQIIYWIVKGENYKLLLIDTPKNDYSRFVPKALMALISPDEEAGVVHDIGKDLLLPQDIQQFFVGKIPSNEKDSTWTNSGRAIGSGVGVLFSKIGGTDWGYANLVWGLTQKPEVLEPLLARVYPEALQILRSADTTISSVLFNLAAYTQDLFHLARIWDGYDYKHDIIQFNAALMKRPKALRWWLDTLHPAQFDDAGIITPVPHNATIHLLFTGLISHLNSTNPTWKWVDLAKLQKLSFEEQAEIASKHLPKKIVIERNDVPYYAKAITPILQWAKVWDEYEAQPRFSVREWVLDENPAKKILCFSPSGRFKEMSDGLVRGLLFFISGLIDDKFFPDDNPREGQLRRFYVVCDEFQSRGNMKDFIFPILERGRSKGVTLVLACQDLAQLKSVYDEEFVAFLQANTGNFIVLGVNSGTTAEQISNLVGKKTISKLHTSQSFQADGKSSSINYQEHEGLVLSPDECNSKLGVDESTGMVRYLYVPGLLPKAYILSTPLVKYSVVYKPQEPDWMKGSDKEPENITERDVRDRLLGATGGVKKKLTDEQPVPDAADEINDEMPDFEPSPEEEEAMARATQAQETKPLYRLPSEEVDMQGDLLKEGVTDLIGGHALTTIKQVADILDGSKSHLTTSKKKYLEEWDKVKESRNQSLELTKRK